MICAVLVELACRNVQGKLALESDFIGNLTTSLAEDVHRHVITDLGHPGAFVTLANGVLGALADQLLLHPFVDPSVGKYGIPDRGSE